MIIIDGSFGEGGGQVVRSALSLSLLTGEAFRIKNVREGRKSPGLLRQHLTAVKACAAIGSAKLTGVGLGAREFTFEPKSIRGGDYQFQIGTAGSTSLVLQTILLPLLAADSPSRVVIEGGTHNSASPPFDFLDRAYLPLLRSAGAQVLLTLDRAGFYPAGGGRIVLEIEPSKAAARIDLLTRGKLLKRECRAVVAGISGEIAKRELIAFNEIMAWDDSELAILQLPDDVGPGNALIAELRYETVTHIFTAFGEKRVSSEEVAKNLAQQIRNFLKYDIAVDTQLADQLLLPCLWAGGGRFTTHDLSSHFTTNLALIKQFVKLQSALTGDEVKTVQIDSL